MAQNPHNAPVYVLTMVMRGRHTAKLIALASNYSLARFAAQLHSQRLSAVGFQFFA